MWKSSNPKARTATKTEKIGNEQTAKTKIAWFNRSSILFALAIVSVIGATVLVVWQLRENDDSHLFDSLRPVRLVSWKVSAGGYYTDYRLSHNGKMVAYSSSQDGENESIFVKQTVDGEEIRITKDKWLNHSPIWSPDDQRIAFVSIREGQIGIYTSPSLGGAEILIKIISEGDPSLRHWSKDDTAIFYELTGNLFRLDLATREAVQITNFDLSLKKRDISVSRRMRTKSPIVTKPTGKRMFG